MTRTENDLRNALSELEQRADRYGAPFTSESIRAAVTEDRLSGDVAPRRSARWIPPVAAAASVAAAVTAFALSNQHSSVPPQHKAAGGTSTSNEPVRPRTAAALSSARPTPTATASRVPATSAAGILGDAAAKLAAAPWTTPAAKDFFYVRTTQATTWTSVSGTRAGNGHTSAGVKIWVPACKNGRFIGGQTGSCTVSSVPHYLADAPTAPRAWDAYLERMAPGSRSANGQGKIIVGVLHEDLVAPKAAAALLRYTERCPGLHTLAIRPVAGETLIGVTCTSMTNGSYSLVFDATSHAFVGFAPVGSDGRQDAPAEIIRRTGIVPAIGDAP